MLLDRWAGWEKVYLCYEVEHFAVDMLTEATITLPNFNKDSSMQW